MERRKLKRLLGYVMKRGKKQTAQKILSQTLHLVQTPRSASPFPYLIQGIQRSNPYFKVRPVQVQEVTKVQPIPLTQQEQESGAIKRWFKALVKAKGSSFASKMSHQLLLITKTPSQSEVHQQLLAFHRHLESSRYQ